MTFLRLIINTLAFGQIRTTGRASVFALGLCSLLFSVGSFAQDSSYVIGTNDVIAISVYGEEDLSFEEVRIGDSGNVTYPFLGEISTKDRTVNEFEQAIRLGLIDGEFLINPEVTVSIIIYRPFYIDGEVKDPGSYPFEPGLTLRKAVSIAGGFTERASRSKITILAEDSVEDDNPDSVDNLDVVVSPGDIITVNERFF